MTTLIFVRHGQSVANLHKIFAGHTDIPLTEIGHRQAQATAEYLDRYHIDHIYASDLERAYQTAEHTAARRGMQIIKDPMLREVFAGEWEGMTYGELEQAFPKEYDTWKYHTSRAHPVGGESMKQLSIRAKAAIDRIVRDHRGECVSIFAHAALLRTLAWRWHGFDLFCEDRAHLDEADCVPHWNNAAVSVAEYDDEGNANVVLYAHSEHLQEFYDN